MTHRDAFGNGHDGGAPNFGDGAEFELNERFADWVDGRLSPEELEALEAELAADDGLRAQADEYRSLVATVQHHLNTACDEDDEFYDEEPPLGFADSVMSEMPGTQRGRLIPFLASLAAAAAMVAIFVVLMDLSNAPNSTESAALDVPTAVPVEGSTHREPAATDEVASPRLSPAGLAETASPAEKASPVEKASPTRTSPAKKAGVAERENTADTSRGRRLEDSQKSVDRAKAARAPSSPVNDAEALRTESKEEAAKNKSTARRLQQGQKQRATGEQDKQPEAEEKKAADKDGAFGRATPSSKRPADDKGVAGDARAESPPTNPTAPAKSRAQLQSGATPGSVGEEVRKFAELYLTEARSGPKKAGGAPPNTIQSDTTPSTNEGNAAANDGPSRDAARSRARGSRRARPGEENQRSRGGGGRGGARDPAGGGNGVSDGTPVLLVTLRSGELPSRSVPGRAAAGESESPSAPGPVPGPASPGAPRQKPPASPVTGGAKTGRGLAEAGKPADSKPADGRPADGKPGERKSDGSKPADQATKPDAAKDATEDDAKRRDRAQLAKKSKAKSPPPGDSGGLDSETRGRATRFRVARESLTEFLRDRESATTSNTLSADAVVVRPDVSQIRRDFGRRDRDDYRYVAGDEIYEVTGDRAQVQRFFLGLRDYLASSDARLAKNQQRLPSQAGRSSGYLEAQVPITVKKINPVRERRFFGSSLGSQRRRSGNVASGRAMRFYLVLRHRP